jgi:hypothetical protein
MVFSGETVERRYWGTKMGKYRVLSSSPAQEALSTGPCIDEQEVGRTVFPAPDANGLFDAVRFGEVIAIKRSSSLVIRLEIVRIAPATWAAGLAAQCGDFLLNLPLTNDRVASSWDQAAISVLLPALTEIYSQRHQLPTRSARARELLVTTFLEKLPNSLKTNIIKQLLKPT